MKSVVEIDAGQHRKHVSLQERDQQVEGDQRDGQRQRCQTAHPTDYAERGAEQGDESRKHLDRDMTGQDVSEQSYAVGERPRQEGDDFDRDHQRQDVDRNARRHENLEEFQAVFVEAIDQYREEHEQRERGRDDDLACDREGVGNDADQVRDQDKHEQRVHQREEPHAIHAAGGADHVGYELVAQFGHRLETAGYQLLASKAANRQQENYRHRDQHIGRGIGEVDGVIANLSDLKEVVDFELVDRVYGHARGSFSTGPVSKAQLSPRGLPTIPRRNYTDIGGSGQGRSSASRPELSG